MALLLVHAAATLAMVGLIWFVQVVHYPLFDLASERQFERFASEHQKRTSWVVAPLMLTEAAMSVALLVVPTAGATGKLPWLGAALLALIWIITATFQVPLHRRFLRGRDPAAVRRLVATNWLRTAAWTVRGWVALALIAEALA